MYVASYTKMHSNAHMMDPARDQQLAELCRQVSCTVWNVCVTDTQHQHHRKRQIHSADRSSIWQVTN